MRTLLGLSIIGLFLGTATGQTPEGKWESLLPAIDPQRDAIAGKWSKDSAGLKVEAASGARLVIPVAPRGEYDFRVSFTRQRGQHSIALIFPLGEGQAAYEVDAWGEHLGGIQNIAGKSLKENATRTPNVALKNGQRYTMTVEVRKGQVRTLLDDKVIATHRTDGRDLSLSNLWALPQKGTLALGAWEAETVFHSVEARTLDGAPLVKATTTPTPPKTTPEKATGKRVLIVVANYHFFYREYGDPRAELEKAGIKVTVAAGQKGLCRPHAGSGQGPDGGNIQADLALADVKADDYDAILFSGGWGASAYQFAFPGRYNDAGYNGDRATKATVNRVINDFVAKDRYVCALCNGVSVLAWARVKDQSLLKGKRVCAPVREAPAGVYDGRAAQPSCRWHPEKNGALLSPAGTIGRPGTAEDDVLVDGKIVTGEDDISAREMGRRIVQLLAAGK